MPEGRGRKRTIRVLSDSPSTDHIRVRRELTLKEFSTRLHMLMAERLWTQAETARQAGMLRASVSDYVHGRILPDPINLKKLAKAFGISEADLLPNIDHQVIEQEVNPAFEIRASQQDPSRQWIKLNREVSPMTAVKIQQALAEEDMAPRRK